MSKVPLPPTMTDEEKAKHTLEVERAKAALRVEETFPEADQCPGCARERARTGDPTFLCDEHLRRIYGV
jgi:hypothetical protein